MSERMNDSVWTRANTGFGEPGDANLDIQLNNKAYY
jgi:hypothetical protein